MLTFYYFFRNDNPHLDKLHPPQMDELVAQLQINPPPKLHTLELQELKPRVLPVPLQEIPHMTGEKFKDRCVIQYETMRKATWFDSHTPPNLVNCPQKLFLIEDQGEAFDFAISEIERQKMIGISIQGKNLCRSGNDRKIFGNLFFRMR